MVARSVPGCKAGSKGPGIAGTNREIELALV